MFPHRYLESKLSPNVHPNRIWAVLGGSGVVISGVISKVTIIIIITHIRGLIAPLITTHEPPSSRVKPHFRGPPACRQSGRRLAQSVHEQLLEGPKQLPILFWGFLI